MTSLSSGQMNAEPRPTVATYALRLGDDALILAQRLGEWIARAPEIEEDVALTNIGLDLLGQARVLLTYAGEVEGLGRSEDDLAYLRHEREFQNLQLVERPNDDFAVTMVRQLLFSAYQYELYQRLQGSTDERLAAVAARAVKEVSYHRDHASQWVIRLGDGTEDSHGRMRAGLDRIWPYADEMFTPDDLERDLVTQGVAVDSALLRAPWDAYLDEVLAEATLDRPAGRPAGGEQSGGQSGRQGVHTEAFGYLVAEMQHLHRSYPGASW